LYIGDALDSKFFNVLGTIFACSVFLLWLVVAFATAKGAVSGKLFYAPCLQNLKPRVDSQESILNAAA